MAIPAIIGVGSFIAEELGAVAVGEAIAEGAATVGALTEAGSAVTTGVGSLAEGLASGFAPELVPQIIGGEAFYDAAETTAGTLLPRAAPGSISSSVSSTIKGLVGTGVAGTVTGLKRKFEGNDNKQTKKASAHEPEDFQTPTKVDFTPAHPDQSTAAVTDTTTAGDMSGGGDVQMEKGDAAVQATPKVANAATQVSGQNESMMGIMGGGSSVSFPGSKLAEGTTFTKRYRRHQKINVATQAVPAISTTQSGFTGDPANNTLCTYDWSILPNNLLEYYVNFHDLYMDMPRNCVGIRVKSLRITCVNSQVSLQLPFEATTRTSVSDPYYMIAIDEQQIFQNCSMRGAVNNGIEYTPNIGLADMANADGYIKGNEAITLNALVEWYPGTTFVNWNGSPIAYTAAKCNRDILSILPFEVKYPPSPWTWSWTNPNGSFQESVFKAALSNDLGVDCHIINANTQVQQFKYGTKYGTGDSDEVVIDVNRIVNLVPSILIKPQKNGMGSTEITASVQMNLIYEAEVEFMCHSKPGFNNRNGIFQSLDNVMTNPNTYITRAPIRGNLRRDATKTEY